MAASFVSVLGLLGANTREGSSGRERDRFADDIIGVFVPELGVIVRRRDGYHNDCQVVCAGHCQIQGELPIGSDDSSSTVRVGVDTKAFSSGIVDVRPEGGVRRCRTLDGNLRASNRAPRLRRGDDGLGGLLGHYLRRGGRRLSGFLGNGLARFCHDRSRGARRSV